MKVEEIVKQLEEAGIDAGIVSAVKSLDASAEVERLTGELKAEQGKSAQFLTDKKGLKEKLELIEKERDDLKNSTLTVDEKWQKQIDELKGTIKERDDALESEKKAHATEKREAEEIKIASALKPASGVASSTLNTLVKTALTEIADLGDSEAVESAIKNLTENNKGLFATETPAGTGGKHSSGGVSEQPATIGGAVSSAWNTAK